MLSPLRNRFGIPGVISVIALVFAMFGGAYAASNNSGGGKATASAKGKPGPRGPRGKTGPAGPAGPAGPQGPAGANGKDGSNGANGTNGKDGAKGKDGTNGTNGAPGKDGKGVIAAKFTGGSEPVGNPCEGAGGTEIEVEESEEANYACNGKAGDPAEYPDHLLPGKTEAGAWSFNVPAGTEEERMTISFPIPLQGPSGLPEPGVHFDVEGTGDACKGTAIEPTAPPGNLCIYKQVLSNAGFGEIGDITFANVGTSPFGALVSFTVSNEANPAFGYGSWALSG